MPSRKTAGLATLRENRVNAAKSILTRTVLRLFGGSLRIEWCVDELLGDLLCVVVIAPGLQSLVVFSNGALAIAFGIVRIAALDAGPGLDPRRLAAGAVNGGLKIVERQLPVFLLKIDQAQIVIDPGVVAVKLERGFQLLLRLGVLPFVEQLNTAAGDNGNFQIVRHAQDFVVGIDFGVNRLAARFEIKVLTLAVQVERFGLRVTFGMQRQLNRQ